MSPEVTTQPTVLATRRSAERVELDIVVPETLLYCRGHFPGHPILPGVVQLDWAVTTGRSLFALGDAPPATFQVKFRKIITPGEQLVLVLAYEEGKRRLSFEYRDGEGARSSGRLSFPGI